VPKLTNSNAGIQHIFWEGEPHSEELSRLTRVRVRQGRSSGREGRGKRTRWD